MDSFISFIIAFNGNYTFGVTVQWFDQNDQSEVLEKGDSVTLELIQISYLTDKLVV